MPLLEINQTRYISASVRLPESTAEQVDQYAAFIHASADDVGPGSQLCLFDGP
jgi:hypothetical protein